MKAFITGGAGFIGSNLTEKLLADGHEVIGIDNFNNYYHPAIKEQNIMSFQDHDKFSLYRVDIIEFDKLRDIFASEKIDKVIHLAARAGVRASIEQPLLYNQVNSQGMANLLELSKEHNIQNFVFASSSSVYGEREDVPFHEDDEIKPISPYAASKKAGELLGYTYNHLYKIPFTALRFFTVYGPKGSPDMAPYKFMKAIINDKTISVYGRGDHVRDFTYVGDIVDGIISAADKNLPYEVINLGNANPTVLMDFIQTWSNVIGKRVQIEYLEERLGDVSKTYADTSKAKELLGWQAQTDLAEGLRQMYEYFKDL